MNNKKIRLCLLTIIIAIFMLFSATAYATDPEDEARKAELHKAIQATANAYRARGVNLQYAYTLMEYDMAPEEATSDNLKFAMCSNFIWNVYYRTLGISIPDSTNTILKKVKEYQNEGNEQYPEGIVLAFDEEKLDDVKEQGFLDVVVPNLEPCDIIYYRHSSSGHEMLVYDVIKDETGNVVDAWLLHSNSNGGDTNHKWEVSDVNNEFALSYPNMYHPDKDGAITEVKMSEFFKNTSNHLKTMTSFAVTRPIMNKENQYVDYSSKPLISGTITYSITNEAQDRINYPDIYIEKTCNYENNSVVPVGQTLTYTTTIKNYSNKKYEGLKLVENIPDGTTYVSGGTKNGNTVVWNNISINAGSVKKYSYSIIIPNNIGKVIEAKGKVNSIPTTTVTNIVGKNFNDEEISMLKTTYTSLKSDSSLTGMKFANELYKQAFGIDIGISKLKVSQILNDNNKNILDNIKTLLNDNRYKDNYWWYSASSIAERLEIDFNSKIPREVNMKPGELILTAFIPKENGQYNYDKEEDCTYMYLDDKLYDLDAKGTYSQSPYHNTDAENISNIDYVLELLSYEGRRNGVWVTDNYLSDKGAVKIVVLSPANLIPRDDGAIYPEKLNNYSVGTKYYDTLAEAYASVSSTSGTIKVEKDCADISNLTINGNKTITINTNGKTITTSEMIRNYGTLNINGTGTIQTLESKGNRIDYLLYNQGTVNVNGATLNHRGSVWRYWYTIVSNGGIVNINSGTVECTKPSYEGTSYIGRTIYQANGSIINIKGGNVINNAGNMAVYSYVSDNYSSSGGEINVLGGNIISEARNAIYFGGDNKSDTNEVYENTTNLLISGGIVKTNSESKSPAVYFASNTKGNAVITGGTIISKSYMAIYNDGLGNITIGVNDSTISKTTPVIQGGEKGVSTSSKAFNYYDGIIRGGASPLNGKTSSYSITVPNGHEVVEYSTTIDGVTYKALKLNSIIKNYEVNGEPYATLEDAYNAISGTSGTIKVLENNTDASTFTIESGKKVTLNMNGKIVTKTTTGITNNGELTISGSGVFQTDYYENNAILILIQNEGTLTIDGSTIKSRGSKSGIWYAIRSTAGIINMNSGLVSTEPAFNDSTTSLTKYPRTIHLAGNSTLNMNGGKIESTCSNGYAVMVYATGTLDANSTINMSGGEIVSAESYGIYASAVDNKVVTINLSITSGNVSGKHGICMNNRSTGTVNLLGGTVKGTNGYGVYNIGTGVVVLGKKDGNIHSTSPIIQGKSYGVLSSNGFKFYDGIIKGVTNPYSGDIVDKESDCIIKNSTETIGSIQYKTCRMTSNAIPNYGVGEDVFETLKDAYDAITGSSGTIKVLQDNLDSVLLDIENGKTITIDTNGHTMTRQAMLYNHGTLKIIGNGRIETLDAGENTVTYLIMNYGNLEITDAEIENKGILTGSWYTIYCAGGNATINSGTISSSLTSDETSTGYGRTICAQDLSNIYIKGGNIVAYPQNAVAIIMNTSAAHVAKGSINISGGTIVSKDRNAIYVQSAEGSTAEVDLNITGGTITSEAEKRDAIYYGTNTKGNIVIEGGKIVSKGLNGIDSLGTANIIIGKEDGNVSTTSPIIQGNNCAIYSNNGFDFYDGILKGVNEVHIGIINATESDYEAVTGAETINGVEFKTKTLREKPEYIKGDVNHDNKITIVDVRLLLQKAINNSYSADEMDVIDINNDNKVTIIDVRMLLQQIINN